MRKVNSHSKEKIWENTWENMGKHFKVKSFWNFLLEAEIHAVPNTWEKWISIVQKKYGKTQTISNLWIS